MKLSTFVIYAPLPELLPNMVVPLQSKITLSSDILNTPLSVVSFIAKEFPQNVLVVFTT